MYYHGSKYDPKSQVCNYIIFLYFIATTLSGLKIYINMFSCMVLYIIKSFIYVTEKSFKFVKNELKTMSRKELL